MALTWETKEEIWLLFFKGDSKESIASEVKRKWKKVEGEFPVNKRVVYKVIKEWENIPQEQISLLRPELQEIKKAEVEHFGKIWKILEELREELFHLLPEKFLEQLAELEKQRMYHLDRWFPEDVLKTERAREEHGSTLVLPVEYDPFSEIPLQFYSKLLMVAPENAEKLQKPPFQSLQRHLSSDYYDELWNSLYRLKENSSYVKAMVWLFQELSYLLNHVLEESFKDTIPNDMKVKIIRPDWQGLLTLLVNRALQGKEWMGNSVVYLSTDSKDELEVTLSICEEAYLLTPHFVETACLGAIRLDEPKPYEIVSSFHGIGMLKKGEKVIALGLPKSLEGSRNFHYKLTCNLGKFLGERADKAIAQIKEGEKIIGEIQKILAETFQEGTLPGVCSYCPISIQRVRGFGDIAPKKQESRRNIGKPM